MEPSSLPAPLDVIARAITLEYGRLLHGHFALFETAADDDFPAGQQRFQDQLLARIPTTRQRVLLCGADLSALAQALRQAGHEVVVCDDELATEIDDGSVLPRLPLFDCVIQPGSVAYPQLLELLSRAVGRLQPGGLLLWCGEFLLPVIRQRRDPLPLLLTFERLSVRLGLQSQQRLDLTDSCLPGLEMAARLLSKFAARLQDEWGVDEERLQRAEQHLQELRDSFAQRRNSLLLFTLRKSPDANATQVTYGDIHSFPAGEIAPVFEASFGHPFNAGLWRWKYGAGRGRAIVARKNGTIVAHYGGAPRDIDYFGSPHKAIQICDVMVLPTERSHYGSDSLFFKVAATFLEREIGFSVEHLLGFGFPNLKAMHIATRLGLYEKTDDFVEVLWPATRESGRRAGDDCLPLDLGDAALRTIIDGPWQAMRQALREGIVGWRDPGYLYYRYGQHPGGDYRSYLISGSRGAQPFAVAVLRPHQDELLLMDLVCHPGRIPEALAALLNDSGAMPSGTRLKCWITRGHHQHFLCAGAERRELQIEIPCHSWTPGPSAETLYGKWWLTAGDMDFL